MVVLGLFSVDDVVKPDHFVYEQGDKRLNSATVSGEDELHTYIIRHFSHPMLSSWTSPLAKACTIAYDL